MEILVILSGFGQQKTNPIQSQTKPILGKSKEKGKIRASPESIRIGDLKKQSQFSKGRNERKVLSYNVL